MFEFVVIGIKYEKKNLIRFK